MILLCGIPTEKPLAMVAEQLDALGTPYLFFNQRRAAAMAMEWEVVGGDVRGRLGLGEQSVELTEICGVYTRLMDDRALPELKGEAEGSWPRVHSRSLHDCLYRWYEVATARVVNRASPQGSNGSKPYQAQLIRRAGFSVPETLVTNQPELVRDFQREHGRVIYKSMSGVRSIVVELTEVDLERVDHVRWCPVQFQAFVPGTNVRVHTIGDDVFATRIDSDVTDYRYAGQQGGEAKLTATELPDDLTQACLALSAGLGLTFAGIDLKVTPDGQVFCFEVNPSPAFSYFELNSGQPIARAVARYLAEG